MRAIRDHYEAGRPTSRWLSLGEYESPFNVQNCHSFTVYFFVSAFAHLQHADGYRIMIVHASRHSPLNLNNDVRAAPWWMPGLSPPPTYRRTKATNAFLGHRDNFLPRHWIMKIVLFMNVNFWSVKKVQEMVHRRNYVMTWKVFMIAMACLLNFIIENNPPSEREIFIPQILLHRKKLWKLNEQKRMNSSSRKNSSTGQNECGALAGTVILCEMRWETGSGRGNEADLSFDMSFSLANFH